MLPIAEANTVESAAAVVAAVGTVGAVLVALYLPLVRDRRLAPRLDLSLGRQAHGVELRRSVNGQVNRLRLKISAETGKKTAHNVEVLLSAAWAVPSMPEREILVVDHEPLKWLGGGESVAQVTSISLAPGVSREVSLAWIGRPLDLYETIGLRRPTDAEIEAADRGESDDRWITEAFGIFDVHPGPDSMPLFLEPHLEYRLRLDVTAQDIETASYEVSCFVQPRWGRSMQSEAEDPPPKTHADRNVNPVLIAAAWSDIEAVPSDRPFAPMQGVIAYGDPK